MNEKTNNSLYEKKVDLVVIGGGPAGMAACVEAHQLGIEKIILIERDIVLGGILNQCIHDGFGTIKFNKLLSGPEYSQRFINMVNEDKITVLNSTMVLKLDGKNVYATNKDLGLIFIESKAIILAMGCRERSRFQVNILGTRPSGVLTAGTVQKYINIDGYLPGKNAVILGSGDIGLIMARRMTLEGINVIGVYELMENPGGLRRNISQCLHDFDIPLHLLTTVTKIHGKKHIEGVTVSKVDKNRNIIPNSDEYIKCDLLVLSVGLIPENEISIDAGIELHNITKGPIVDNDMMTSTEGIFACGNVATVFDLVDYVSYTGQVAAQGAFKYINKINETSEPIYNINAGENVLFTFPQIIKSECEEVSIYFRVRKTILNAKITVVIDGEEVYSEKHPIVTPPEMVKLDLNTKKINRKFNTLEINVD